LVRMGHFGPTQQAIEVKNELMSQIDNYLEQYQIVKDDRLKELNKMILSRRLEYIKVDE